MTLLNDKGKDAELLSFNLKPFNTNGENYQSVIACVEVRYKQKGSNFQDSYFAKINPCYPTNAHTEVLETMFQIETDVLFIIVKGMNKQLHELNLPRIATPKLYARNLEKGREVFIAENLRSQGFITIDKRKVMDFDHTVLVLKELGRFHASSLLYEETLHPKSIEESFNLKDPRFDYNHESFKVFDKFNTSIVRILSEILMKEGPKYEKCVSWIHDHLDRMTGYFFDKNIPVKPFNLLLHGDCWTNNFLFRYDKINMPVDIRFVDFQWSRKGSPGRDLNYFFYMCLDGKLRTEKMPQMLSIYYHSFCEVLKRAGKPIPFSYEELVLEVKNRKIFGLVSIMMLLTGVQVDHVFDSVFEEDPDSHMKMKNLTVNAMNDSKCPLKERLFSIFDEFIDDKSFD
ncbi:UNVERIFIED_CONTAM: hypothetical protein RMT77_000163 [Armadillidium vulgare]